MNMSAIKVSGIKTLCLVLLSMIALNVSAAKLYRFVIDGKTIVKDSIPPEYKKYGYDVLNGRGLVVKSVPPAPTAAELAMIKRREAAEEKRKQLKKDQKEADKELLRLYSSLEEIEKARERKIVDIENYISLVNKRIQSLTEQLDKAEQKAANLERNGREVPVEIRLEIAQLQSQIRDSNASITDRQSEKQKVTNEFAKTYARYDILQKHPIGSLPDEIKRREAIFKKREAEKKKQANSE